MATNCPSTVHETVCVQADVIITPHVEVLEMKSYCMGGVVLQPCAGNLQESCTFSVSQRICIEIPLVFSATATAVPRGIACGSASIGPCNPVPGGCTHTIGYFANHPAVTDALLAAVGGFIVLGDDSKGLSYTVTTANAYQVLSGHTSSPPAPAAEPFAGQYQVLYAQLLAANLNIWAGAACPFAAQAIADANAFLAQSPPGGMAGAPDVQEPLEEFNSGRAPGCPGHCV